MKFKIDQPTLHQALSILSRSVASHPQLPVLANIKLAASKNQLELSATDLQTGVVVSLETASATKGETTVPAKIFADFIASLPAQDVQAELDGLLLKLKCGSFSAEINCISAEEFPEIPKPENKPLLTFTTDDFCSIVSKVAFAAATDEGRPVLTGVLINSTKEGLVFVATDGYRLSQYLDDSIKDLDLKVVVPARTLSEVAKVVSAKPDVDKVEVYDSQGAGQLTFALDQVIISTRLIEGQFPNTEKIIPIQHQTKVEIDLDEFLKAVRVAQVFARDSASVVRLEFDAKGTITLRANTKQMGKNQGQVDGVIEGKENKIAFNVRYLLDLLGIIESKRLEFTMNDPLKPGVFRPLMDTGGPSKPAADDASDDTADQFPEAKSKPAFFHLIMPVRVQE